MPNPKTLSTADYSELERRDRNDNTSISNSYPEQPERTTTGTEYPDRSNGNEFEVEKRNEVYPQQTPNTEVTENDDDKESTNELDKDEEDWDMTKKKQDK